MALKASFKMKIKKKGLDTLKRRIKSAESYVSKTGFWQTMSNDGTMSMASLAFLQEYGRPASVINEAIPARAFFRMSVMNVEANHSNVRRQLKFAIQHILSGSQTTPESLRQVGQVYQEEIQTIITYFDEPANAERTIRMKGKDDPLVDSGKMRDSVKTKVTKRGLDV